MGYPEFYKGLEDVVDIKQLSFESPRLNEGNRDFIPEPGKHSTQNRPGRLGFIATDPHGFTLLNKM